MNNRLDLRRLRGPIATFIATGAAIFFLDAFLRVALGEQCSWLPPIFGTPRFEDFERRVTRFEQMKQTGQVADERLVAVLGLSQVRYDLDPTILKANDPQHRDWMVLGADGRSFDQLAVFSRVLIDSSMRPGLVVLCVARSMTNRNDSAVTGEGLGSVVRNFRTRQYFSVLRDVSWLARHRLLFQEGSALADYQATHDIRAIFGLPMSVTYEPEENPWAIWVVAGPVNNEPDALQRQWEGRRTLFAADQYEHDEKQIAAFAGMVGKLRDRGMRVVCVLMPETQRLRDLYLPIIEQRFNDALAAAGGVLPVADLHESMRDEWFQDDAHLAPGGREQFSSLFPSRIP
jgi:hypothetical protein